MRVMPELKLPSARTEPRSSIQELMSTSYLPGNTPDWLPVSLSENRPLTIAPTPAAPCSPPKRTIPDSRGFPSNVTIPVTETRPRLLPQPAVMFRTTNTKTGRHTLCMEDEVEQ